MACRMDSDVRGDTLFPGDGMDRKAVCEMNESHLCDEWMSQIYEVIG